MGSITISLFSCNNSSSITSSISNNSCSITSSISNNSCCTCTCCSNHSSTCCTNYNCCTGRHNNSSGTSSSYNSFRIGTDETFAVMIKVDHESRFTDAKMTTGMTCNNYFLMNHLIIYAENIIFQSKKK